MKGKKQYFKPYVEIEQFEMDIDVASQESENYWSLREQYEKEFSGSMTWEQFIEMYKDYADDKWCYVTAVIPS